jgi:hypothetical protein
MVKIEELPNEFAQDSANFLLENTFGVIILSALLVAGFRLFFRKVKPHLQETFEAKKYLIYLFTGGLGFLIYYYSNDLGKPLGLAILGASFGSAILDLWEDHLWPYIKRDFARVVIAGAAILGLILAPDIAEWFALPTIIVAISMVSVVGIVVYSKYTGSTTFARNVKKGKERVLSPVARIRAAYKI